MRYCHLFVLAILFSTLTSVCAQNTIVSVPRPATDDTTGLYVVVNEEVRKMDSMMSLWYVQKELHAGKSVLSKLHDDTTVYDNNDSLIFKRLSKIVTAVPLAYNDRVKRFIELYSVQRKRSSSVILGLAQYYYPWMKEIFDKYDVPEELVYITIIESALNPLAVSPAGATGIWQFMYGTGKLYGLEVNTYVDDRRDPYKATDAAARHLRDLYNIFNDWGLAISAYNCGAGNVRKAIQRSGGKTDFWGVSPYLPRETQNYFPAYIGALYMMTYHNLYGIQPANITIPLNVDTVMVSKELHFEQIANILNISMEEITSLNPQYKKSIIPAFNGVRCPLRLQPHDVIRFIALQDTIQKYHYDEYFNPTKNLNTATANANGEIVQVTPNKYHTVRKGETLSKIAAKYGTTVNNLKALNHLRSTNLRIGQKLLVKKGTTVVKPAPTPAVSDNAATAKDSSSVAAQDTVQTPAQAPAPTVQTPKPNSTQTGGYITYVIKKGDTLSSIGRKYGKTAAEIAKYNKISNVNAIQVGQKIKIPR
ncbi:MAG: LysM peptidoglycan-binding domain-containing protein [Bacteroidales bacterium]|nr:LysM peptidoglycan-binding domain-containing protein [Bacteroidales bacterium]